MPPPKRKKKKNEILNSDRKKLWHRPISKNVKAVKPDAALIVAAEPSGSGKRQGRFGVPGPCKRRKRPLGAPAPQGVYRGIEHTTIRNKVSLGVGGGVVKAVGFWEARICGKASGLHSPQRSKMAERAQRLRRGALGLAENGRETSPSPQGALSVTVI